MCKETGRLFSELRSHVCTRSIYLVPTCLCRIAFKAKAYLRKGMLFRDTLLSSPKPVTKNASNNARAHTRRHTHTHKHTHTHTPTHARTHARTHAHTHARGHTHARVRETREFGRTPSNLRQASTASKPTGLRRLIAKISPL